jgi:hypothetical protein
MTDLDRRKGSVTRQDFVPSPDAGELVLEPVPPGHKCSICGQIKSREEFTVDRKSRSGVGSLCRSCKSEHIDKPYNKRTTEQRSLRIRTRRYDITVEGYRDLFDQQCGVCAICKQPETRVAKGTICTLSVDHDHETGRVRGLLCDKCNRGLGMFQEDMERLQSAINYLTSDIWH